MSLKVLVAEGDPQLSDLFGLFLSRHGYTVETASGGLECLAALRRLGPDVIVLDWDLPWGGGAGVLACLPGGNGGPRPAVVLTTYEGPPEPVPDLTAAAVVRCLRKPFPLAELLESVGQATRG